MPSDLLPAGTVAALSGALAPRAALGPDAPSVRRPRGWLLINGQRIEPLTFDVTNNGFFLADTFTGRVHLDNDSTMPVAAWASEDVVEIDAVATDGQRTETLLVGRVDDVEIDYDARQVIISGRDFTADLIETKTTEKWPNKTSSEIAAIIAGRHSLKAVVTATTAQAGTYYSLEHAVLTDETTEWNLLTYLAEQEGFDVFVVGRELHFEKPPERTQAKRWVIKYTPGYGFHAPSANTGSLRMRRNLTVAREVIVKVVSWNAKQKQAFEVTRRADRSRRPRSKSSAPPRTFVFRVPQMTEQQAIEYAERNGAGIYAPPNVAIRSWWGSRKQIGIPAWCSALCTPIPTSRWLCLPAKSGSCWRMGRDLNSWPMAALICSAPWSGPGGWMRLCESWWMSGSRHCSTTTRTPETVNRRRKRSPILT